MNSCQEIQQDRSGEGDRREVHHGDMWRDDSDLVYRISKDGISGHIHIAGQDEIRAPLFGRKRHDD